MVKPTILASALFLATVQPLNAYCSRPDAPYCATSFGNFDDEYEFEQCKSEMEIYQSEIEDFLACQKRENQQAIDEYNEAVESFNRRVRGY